jgi:hypothetical protein
MTSQKRLAFVSMLVIGSVVPIVFVVVPALRIPLLIAYLVLIAADIPIALRRARRKRSKSS